MEIHISQTSIFHNSRHEIAFYVGMHIFLYFENVIYYYFSFVKDRYNMMLGIQELYHYIFDDDSSGYLEEGKNEKKIPDSLNVGWFPLRF